MENSKVLKLDHTFITGTMKVCWRWCVKDCPVLGNSQELLPTIDITANIIHHKNCQLSVHLSIQGQKKNHIPNQELFFHPYIFSKYFRNAGEHCSSYNNGYLGRQHNHRPYNGDSRGELRGNGFSRVHEPDHQSSCRLHGDLHCSGIVNFAPGFSPDTEVKRIRQLKYPIPSDFLVPAG